jgi:small subunit ribosomal protein S16
MRLARYGAKKKPFYRIVVADSRSPRDGRFLEILGTFNPLRETENLEINQEKAVSWLKKGVQPSTTVKSLLKKKGIEA